MLFVDVRGSTKVAEGLRAAEFSHLMNQFYKATTGVLIKTNAFIDKFVGDEVIGLYFPLFTGRDHAGAAIKAARELLAVTKQAVAGHQTLPIGMGIHTGVAYVGTVSGTEGSVTDVTALGDNVNITARLASQAGAGEALVSEAAFTAAGVDPGTAEHRQLELKGKSEPVNVWVLKS